MGSHGFPWVPMGPMGSHGVPMGSMENPRMSEIMNFNENHYSARQKIGDPGSKSMRNVFPLHPVTSKRPESPYGAKYFVLAENPVFQFFALLDFIGPRLVVILSAYKNAKYGTIGQKRDPIRPTNQKN